MGLDFSRIEDTTELEKVHSESANGIEHLKYYESDNGEKRHIDYSLSSSQKEVAEHWVNGDTQILNYRVGYGGGKTYLGARILIKSAWQIPDSRWLCMSETYAEGWETTYRVLFENLPGYDGENPESSPIVKDYVDHREKHIVFENGSKIVLGSADKSDKHKGDTFAGIWADEVALYSTDLWDLTEMLLSRLRSDNPPRVMLWTTTTDPTNPRNDYYQITQSGIQKNGEPHSWDIVDIQGNSLKNPFLSEEAKQNLYQTHKHNEEQGLKGGFKPVDGQIYPQFSEDTHVVSRSEISLTDGVRLYGYDAGWNDNRVVLEIGRTEFGQYVVLDEFYRSESMVKEAIDWIKDKPTGTLYSEHEPEQIERFRKVSGLRVLKADKDIDLGIDAVKQRLSEDHTGRVGLLVCEDCVNTIREFQNYTEINGKSDDHAMDSLRYAIFTNGGITGSSQKRESQNTSTVSTTTKEQVISQVRQRRSSSIGHGKDPDEVFKQKDD